jgi:hypothetical protein
LNQEIPQAVAFSELYNNYNHELWEHRKWSDQKIISSI